MNENSDAALLSSIKELLVLILGERRARAEDREIDYRFCTYPSILFTWSGIMYHT